MLGIFVIKAGSPAPGLHVEAGHLPGHNREVIDKRADVEEAEVDARFAGIDDVESMITKCSGGVAEGG